LVCVCLPIAAACSSSSNSTPDAARDSAAGSGGSDGSMDAVADGGGPNPASDGSSDGGGDAAPFVLKTFTPPPADPGPASVLFTASGEELAFTGYDFPPTDGMDLVAFVDGWDVKFDRLLVTIDKITLSENPNMAPTDQSKTGPLVAQADGPWAVDLHKKGPLMGAGGGDETAVPITSLDKQNKKAGTPGFDTAAGTTYAFGFDLVPASANAQNVNLDTPEALADYQTMVQNGCTVYYVGTATFKGGTSCITSTGPAGTAFDEIPTPVKFRLCFKSPTSYVNCQDGLAPDGSGPGGMEKRRGFAFLANGSVRAQVTVHTDHPFWDSTEHDSPAHFDQFAARLVGVTGSNLVTLDDVKGVDYTAFTDKAASPLNFRSCLAPALFPISMGYTPPAGQLAFDASKPKSIAKIPATADPTTGFRDFYDYATYNQSTQGHLNTDGLCSVQRHYPSPQ
jgi:hypothetical protein